MLANNVMVWLQHGKGTDFAELYTGAVLFRENRFELYNYEKQVDILRKIAAPEPVADERLYLLPPFFAPLLMPFSLFTFHAAYSLQVAFNLGLLMLVLRLLKHGLGLSAYLSKWLYLAIFGFMPVYLALLQKQTTFLFVLFLTLHVVEAGKPRAGLWAGLLTFKPHLAAIPLLLLAWRRSIAGTIYATATIAFLSVVSIALVC